MDSRLRRRRFDHLAAELSVALGMRAPRHALWLAVARHLGDAARAGAFCGSSLDAFLASEKLPALSGRKRARLRRAVERFDPARATPEELLGGLFGSGASC